jgi:hypothetical protein
MRSRQCLPAAIDVLVPARPNDVFILLSFNSVSHHLLTDPRASPFRPYLHKTRTTRLDHICWRGELRLKLRQQGRHRCPYNYPVGVRQKAGVLSAGGHRASVGAFDRVAIFMSNLRLPTCELATHSEATWHLLQQPLASHVLSIAWTWSPFPFRCRHTECHSLFYFASWCW